MRGVSEVIAIILILLITISLAGLAYMFMSTTMSDVTASAGSTVDTTTSSMLTSFMIDSMDVAKVYVRNTGQNALTGLSVYVNDEPAVYNVTSSSIATGSVGTITIYSFIPDGATVKVVSPSGFSASKVANPCGKAVGCWKFDEGTETTAYDSSPYGNTGTLFNGANYTTGRFGSGLMLDGSNDFVNVGNASILNPSNAMSVSSWIYPTNFTSCCRRIIDKGYLSQYLLYLGGVTPNYITFSANISGTIRSVSTPASYSLNNWYFVAGTYDGDKLRIYVNGVLQGTSASYPGILDVSTNKLAIGSRPDGGEPFNGIIDEVRIYNRVIY